VQQEKRGRVFGTGLSVKDGEPICLCRAIKSRVLHGTFLSLGLGQPLIRCEHHRNHQRHAGDLQAAGPTRRAEKAHRLATLMRVSTAARWSTKPCHVGVRKQIHVRSPSQRGAPRDVQSGLEGACQREVPPAFGLITKNARSHGSTFFRRGPLAAQKTTTAEESRRGPFVPLMQLVATVCRTSLAKSAEPRGGMLPTSQYYDDSN
jgi:hypothetical protein